MACEQQIVTSHYSVQRSESYGRHEKPNQNQGSFVKSNSFNSSQKLSMGGGGWITSLVPSSFPPGTDPQIIRVFKMVDEDKSGFIEDKELQRALSSCNQTFSLRTIHLLIQQHTNNPHASKIGPKEFISMFYCLQNWRETFMKFDADRSGKIDMCELETALKCLGFTISPCVLNMLVYKYDKNGGKKKGLLYDNFIECCLTVKGLTDKFKEKDNKCTGYASFSYDDFMMTVLPFLNA